MGPPVHFRTLHSRTGSRGCGPRAAWYSHAAAAVIPSRAREAHVKVLVVGSGGREHALCAALARSPNVERVYVAPGNDGMAGVATCVSDLLTTHTQGLVAFAQSMG